MVTLGAVLNYAIYPVSRRFLDEGSFNTVVIVLSLALQAISLLAALNIVSFRYSRDATRQKAIPAVQRFFLMLCFVASIIFVLLSPLIGSVLHITDPLYYLLIGTFVMLSVPQYVLTGVLQANHKLGKLGVSILVTSSTQLMLTAMFGSMWGATGVVAANTAGLIVGLIFYYLFGRQFVTSSERSLFGFPTKTDRHILASEKKYLVGVIITAFILSFVPVVDLFFIQSKYAETSSMYAAPYLVGKLVYFAGAILMWTIIPRLYTMSDQLRNMLMPKLLLMLGLISMVGVAALYLLRQPLLQLFGAEYSDLLGSWMMWGVLHKIAGLFFLFIVTIALCDGKARLGIVLSGMLFAVYGSIYFMPISDISTLLISLVVTTLIVLLSYTIMKRRLT